jgi:hypothetical protein
LSESRTIRYTRLRTTAARKARLKSIGATARRRRNIALPTTPTPRRPIGAGGMRGASRSGSACVITTHALFARKVQRKASNGFAGFAFGGSSLDRQKSRPIRASSQRCRSMTNVCARTPRNAGTGPELRIPGAAAQTGMLSGARIQPDSRKSVRVFKGIICDDISEFESHMPSQAVPSLSDISGLRNCAPRCRPRFHRRRTESRGTANRPARPCALARTFERSTIGCACQPHAVEARQGTPDRSLSSSTMWSRPVAFARRTARPGWWPAAHTFNRTAISWS